MSDLVDQLAEEWGWETKPPPYDGTERRLMANANRCTVWPTHVMVNQGRFEPMFSDRFECACGESAYWNRDEGKARAASGRPLDVLIGELGL